MFITPMYPLIYINQYILTSGPFCLGLRINVHEILKKRIKLMEWGTENYIYHLSVAQTFKYNMAVDAIADLFEERTIQDNKRGQKID